MKRITVLGANGRVGRLVVSLLLEKSYDVTAFVYHDDGSFDANHVRVAQGDVHDVSSVEAALTDGDAVICTLGSWGTPQKDIVSSGVRAIIPYMQKNKIKRIISLTGAESRASGDDLSLIHRAMYIGISVGAGKILRDGEDHITQLEQSRLDWTVIRSPVMTETGATKYRLSSKRCLPWQTIHRHAVAKAMVD
ncbi:MAG: NAD(P)-binding oxidoreductase, partial [Candidatus Saccharimonadales bacterium]